MKIIKRIIVKLKKKLDEAIDFITGKEKYLTHEFRRITEVRPEVKEHDKQQLAENMRNKNIGRKR